MPCHDHFYARNVHTYIKIYLFEKLSISADMKLMKQCEPNPAFARVFVFAFDPVSGRFIAAAGGDHRWPPVITVEVRVDLRGVVVMRPLS